MNKLACGCPYVTFENYKNRHMTQYYDKLNKRLVYIGDASNSDFWDKHWTKNTIKKMYSKKVSSFDYVINSTKKQLSKNSLILEGGCGTGQQVFKLQKSGYKVIGVDYAEKTIKTVKQENPELDIRLGDVRKLDFSNNYFDGYWSFGVIEHFYNGYDEILKEMQRVIKPERYLFITFPHMSKLRKFKARKNKYPIWENNENEITNFYQFALNEKTVIQDLKKLNFKLVQTHHLAGIKGLKDEINVLKKPLQRIYNSKRITGKILSGIISLIFNQFTSHSILLILQKEK